MTKPNFDVQAKTTGPTILTNWQTSLGKLLKTYRERSKPRLNQRKLGELVGVSDKTIRNWEDDISLPTAYHLKELLGIYIQLNLLTPGREIEEARQVWLKRQHQDERNSFADFDENWFQTLLSANQRKPLPPTLHKGNLPVLEGRTIGRDQDIATLIALLTQKEPRLITLTGPGGVGKSHLAMRVAAGLGQQFPDGLFLVRLADTSDPFMALETVAKVLGVNEANQADLLTAIAGYIQDKRLLLIADNFEQILKAGPDLVALLQAAPALKILVTSRESLRLPGEYVYEVKPLAQPDEKPRSLDPAALAEYPAVQLLVERASQTRPDFALTTENALPLARLSRQLDGLPLALELAATRLKLFTPQALLNRLEAFNDTQALHLLSKNARSDSEPRQQSLRQTLEWSYNLLNSTQQRLFRRIAVFNGGFLLEAAEAVCGGRGQDELLAPEGQIEKGQILNLLTELLDSNLLTYRPDNEGEPRFYLLRTVREYAIEQLNASPEATEVWLSFCHYFIWLAEQSFRHYRTDQQVVWLNRVEAERENVRGVLWWTLGNGNIKLALQTANAMYRCWDVRGYLSEALRWYEEILGQSAGLEEREIRQMRGAALNRAATLAYDLGQRVKAREYIIGSIEIYRQLNDPAIAPSLDTLASMLYNEGEYDQAYQYLCEELEIFRQQNDQDNLASASSNLAVLEMKRGNYEGAQQWFNQALILHRQRGDRGSLAKIYNNLGIMTDRLGQYEQAAAYLKQSLALRKDLMDKTGIALNLGNLALVALHQERAEDFARFYGAAEALRQEIGVKMRPEEQVTFQEGREAALAQLGETQFKECWAQGERQTWQNLMAEALADAPPV